MTIMYKLTNDKNLVHEIETGATIPRGHRLWSEYEAWLALGNTPLPKDEPPVVHSITPQQSLIAVGGTVKIVVTGAPDTTETITIDGIEQDVTLDDNGRAEIVATMENAGNVYIRDAHGNIAKVEVV